MKHIFVVAFMGFFMIDFGFCLQAIMQTNTQNIAQSITQNITKSSAQLPLQPKKQNPQNLQNPQNPIKIATKHTNKQSKPPHKQSNNANVNPQNMQAFIVKCERCIIYISFDDIEMARLKREFGEEGFYEVVDDMFYHNGELWEYAQANGIEVFSIDPSEYGFVAFADMTLKTSEHKRTHWMCLKDRFPQQIEYLTNPQEEINTYFKISPS